MQDTIPEAITSFQKKMLLANMPDHLYPPCYHAAEDSNNPLSFSDYYLNGKALSVFELEKYIIPFIIAYPVYSLEKMLFNGTNVRGIALIAKTLQNEKCQVTRLELKIECLYLNQDLENGFSAQPLLEALLHKNCKVEHLTLDFCSQALTNPSVKIIAQIIAETKTLKQFSLQNTTLSEEGMRSFTTFLSVETCTLEMLGFDCNNHPTGGEQIIETITNPNCNLQGLKLSTNDEKQAKKIETLMLKALEINRTLIDFVYYCKARPKKLDASLKECLETNSQLPEKCKIIQEFFVESHTFPNDICTILFQYEGLAKRKWPLLQNMICANFPSTLGLSASLQLNQVL